jgi:hypothetical protein
VGGTSFASDPPFLVLPGPKNSVGLRRQFDRRKWLDCVLVGPVAGLTRHQWLLTSTTAHKVGPESPVQDQKGVFVCREVGSVDLTARRTAVQDRADPSLPVPSPPLT